MFQRGMVRKTAWIRVAVVIVTVLGGFENTASAQFNAPAEPAVGEKYHVEVSYGWWNADPTLIINSESLGIPGTDVDLVEDLGIEQKQLGKLNVVLRPATKHKFRFEYLPVKYDGSTTIEREFVFNGQLYRVGLPVSTEADFKTYRFGYEYDFVYRSRGFAGVLVDLKYTDVRVELTTPVRGARIHLRGRPHSDHRVRRPRLPGQELRGRRRGFVLPDSRRAQRGLHRRVHRLGPLRHPQLHE